MATPLAAALLPHVDELVLEYLLFRGFTRSFQSLAAERKRDRTKGFDVEQITAQLLAFVQSYQLEAIVDTWKFLDARFFSRLDGSYTATTRQLEDSWLRLYLVNAIKNGHRDRAIEFFRLLADKLNAKGGKSSGDSWHRWFILPYVQRPENDPFFRPFFDKQWFESFVTSFRNFLSLVFRNMPLPKLLALQVSRTEEPSLRLRLKTSESECTRLRHLNAETAERIQQLEDAGQKMFHMVETLVQHTFAEHFAEADGFGWTDRIAEDEPEASAVLKTLTTLSSQMQELQDVFGPAMRATVTSKDAELAASLLEPPIAVTVPAISDQATRVAPAKMSPSPSSDSLQSPESPNSPAGKTKAFQPLQPALIEEVILRGDRTGHRDGTCKYAHNGRRLVVAHKRQKYIKVLDVDRDGHMKEREEIHTESSVVGVDWVAHSECLVYALDDGTITVWDTETKARTFIISYNADERRPLHLACARSRAVGAVALIDATDNPSALRVQFFAFEDQALRMLSSVDLDEATDLLSLSWASDGSTLAVAEKDGRVTLLSPSETKSQGSWQLGSGDQGLASVAFGPDDQSLLGIESTGSRIHEWLIPDLLNATSPDAPPAKSYRLPGELTEVTEVVTRHLEIQAARSKIAVCSSSSASSCWWTIFERGHTDPVLTSPVHVADQIDAFAWHPLDSTLTAKTAGGKLSTWKISN